MDIRVKKIDELLEKDPSTVTTQEYRDLLKELRDDLENNYCDPIEYCD
jgi:hypothetical protein